MNKNRFRIVFNAARGLRVAVAECARSLGKATTTVCAVVSLFAPPLLAQIVADPSAPGNQRPTVLAAPNGVPLVNIQTPSAAGVSRNTYSQFDVQGNGAILNNSRTDVQTQLGGWVQANPWLAGGGARVILNEVNSANPSHLNGYVEVAGQRAEVIIANPAGIQVNGGGFINVSGVTLTTGTPVMNAGGLESFRVQRGQVHVEGLGLDTRTADHTTILARALQVNAGIWARALTVVAGANDVKADGSAQSSPIAGAGPAPTFMLDVAALGGMYAGKIHLVGSEAGLGVNNAGTLAASDGPFTLLANGQLVNSGAIHSAGDTTVAVSGDMVNAGTGLIAQSGSGTLNLVTTGALDNTDGAILSAGALDITTGAALSNVRGQLQAVDGAHIDTQGALLDNTAGRITAQGVLQLNTGDLLNLAQAGRAAQIGSTGAFTLTARAVHNGADGATPSTLWSGASLSVQADHFTNAGEIAAHAIQLRAVGELDNTAGGTVSALGAIDIGAATFNNRGLVNANEAGGASRVHIDATTLNNLGAGAIFGDQVAIAAQSLSNRPDSGGAGGTTAPVIAARQQLDIGVQTLNNEDSALLYSGGNMAIAGSLDASLAATGQAQAINNLSAEIEAAGDLRIATAALTNERRNASVSQVQLLDETATLNMPSWWINGKNEHGKAIEATSNYSPHLYYLLDPASVLSETRLVTPDGNVVYRIEVALDPTDSVYHAARGAYGGDYGVRERVTVGTGSTVLYAVQRQDGVDNPDQVAGASDVFAADMAGVSTWQRNSLNYNSAYGRCTTHCTMLVVQPGYSDPQSTIQRDTQRALYADHSGLEVSRTAHHTATEDRLNAGAGAAAAIRSGGNMRLDIATSLTNRYADIQAGTVLDLQAGGASVLNQGQTLKRTHRFQITSQTAGGEFFDWTNPDINESIGHAGGTLSGAQQLSITAQNLSNTDLARSTGLPSSGLDFLGVSLPGSNTPITVPHSALFGVASPGSTYLIEGHARFTDHRQWLDSDYLLAALGSDPSVVQKRLGDGFYEQRLIREQVAQLTGRRFLDGHISDEAQFQALMDAGVVYARAWNLVPGVGLSAEQMAQLTTDLIWLVEREVVLPDGTTTKALVPQVYARQVPEGDLRASGALLAGNSVNLQIQQDLVNAGGRIEGGVVIAQAGRDLSNIGGLMQARTELLASAGRHVTISSPTHTTSFSGNYVNQSRTELASIGEMKVGDAAGAKLSIEAGGNVTLQAASVSNASATGTTTIRTDGDVRLDTLTVGGSDNTEYNAKNYARHSNSQEVGTSVAALGDIAIRAGNDVTARAASIEALGDLSVQAGRDITLEAGRSVSESASSVYSKRSGFLSKKSSEEIRSESSDVAIGSSFSGANVVMEAGQDIQIKGSGVNAQDLLLLDAGRDMAIISEQNTASEAYFAETKKSGFNVSKQGIGHGKSAQNGSGSASSSTQAGSSVSGGDVLIVSGRDTLVSASTVVADDLLSIDAGRHVAIVSGVNAQTSEQARHSKSKGVNLIASGFSESVTIAHDNKSNGNDHTSSATAAASTVGSLGGDVTITAGQQYQQTGSDVLTLAGDIHIEAQQVEITEARETRSNTRQQTSKSTVLGATPRNALVDAIKSVKTTAETAQATADTGNSRTQAIGAAATALSAYNTANQVAALVANPQSIASVTIDFNLGSSKSRSESTETAETGRASSVAAAGDVRITASGAGADSGILIRGSDVSAGHDALLKAEGDVRLESGQDRSTLHSTNHSSGASVGVGVSFGASNGITFNASANKANGNAEGQDVVQRNTHIAAGNTARIESGADTTLAGASVTGKTVQAEVGDDLNIESRQDTSTFKSDQQSSGWGVSLCIPPFCYGASSASASSGAQNIESDFASVTEQSGFKAGDGGFQVNVQGDTTLTGGEITSTDKAVEDKWNSFATGGELTLSDVKNRAEYKAEGYSVNLALAVTGAEARTPEQQKLAPAAPAKNEGSAGIGEDSGEASSTTQAAISGIAGNTEARTGDAEAGIAPIFDQDLVQQEIDAQVLITQQFGKLAVPLASSYADNKANDFRRQGQEDEARKWDEGGEYRVALHTGIGALTGGWQGALGAGAGAALIPTLGDAIAELNLPEPVREAATLVAGTALGAAAGSTAGAAASFNQTANNYLSHSPYARVRRLVSQENARLTIACGATCTAQDFQRIDQHVAALERVGNLAEVARHSGMTGQQGVEFAQLVAELLPGYGSAESLAQLITGKSTLTGEEASRFWAAVGIVPLAGGAIRKLAEPSAEFIAAVMRNNLYRDGGDPEYVSRMFHEAARNSTHNATSSEVVLGKYIAGSKDSYETVAKSRSATYFAMPDWDEVQGLLGADKMWEINKAFLDQQIAKGKTFVFPADPRLSAALLPTSYLARELKHLTENGYKISSEGGIFRAVR